MRVLFLGTPEFAVPSLDALLAGPDDVVGVVSQPDRPSGRGLRVAKSPVVARAEEAGIEVLQPERLHAMETLERIGSLRPELLVTCAFGKILRRALLDLPREGCLNVHASLLPRHRGAAPVAKTILEGDAWSGITIFRLDEGMDTGPILLQLPDRVLPDDTAGSLTERLARLGGMALAEACRRIREGMARYQEQDEALATHAPRLRKEDGRIAWDASPDGVERLVRAMTPWPGASAVFRGETVRVVSVEPVDFLACDEPPGCVVSSEGAPIVAVGRGRVRLVRIQPAGKREMEAAAWARGARIEPGETFA